MVYRKTKNKTSNKIFNFFSTEKRELNFIGFTKHNSVPNAFTFSPIKEWKNEEVWTFWTHEDMMKLKSTRPKLWQNKIWMLGMYSSK